MNQEAIIPRWLPVAIVATVAGGGQGRHGDDAATRPTERTRRSRPLITATPAES